MKKIFYLLALTLTFNTLLLNAQTGCPNLVTNGDFEVPNAGFTFGLPLNAGCAANTYSITTRFNLKCSNFPNAGDHTTGSGKFLMIQTSNTATNIWATNVTVTPNTPYTFSFWLAGVLGTAASEGLSVANLAMVVNGVDVPLSITTSNSGGWVKYTYSGTTPAVVTNLPIAIRQITGLGSSDFGIDDISFQSCISDLPCIACTGGVATTNLISNGSFTNGNTGFTSGLTFSTGCGTGLYSIATNFSTFCGGWQNLNANSSPNFLALDGNNNGAVPTVLWQSPVTLTAQTGYCFSFYWALGFAHPSQNFPISIDIVNAAGVPVANGHVGDVTIAGNLSWTNASVMWNSGTLTGGQFIAIRQLTGSLYRDWGIDDICFTVKPPVNCDAAFTFQKINECGNNVQFTNTSTLPTPATPSYSWDFGDGTTSTLQSPSHLFTACGTYNVCMIVNGEGCRDTVCHTVTIIDNVPPVARCKPGVGVLLDANCRYNVKSAFVDDGSKDNCSIKSLDVNPAVLLGCGNTTVTLTVTDWCNNVSTCTMGIQTTESVPPTITCPPNRIYACVPDTAVSISGLATATDNCVGAVTISYTNEVFGNLPCEGGVRRTWTARDACGNTSTCLQSISVFDNIPPTITCPANATVTCTADTIPSVTGRPTVVDNCGGTTTVSYKDVVSGSLPCDGSIVRTWTARDACGRTATCTQSILVRDNVPPIITCPVNTTVACVSDTTPSVTGVATATDNCGGSVTFTHSDVVSGTLPCDGTIRRTWTARDACGNTSTCVQSILVRDNVPPVFSPCPNSITVGTNAGQCFYSSPDGFRIVASDNCSTGLSLTCTWTNPSGEIVPFTSQNQFPKGINTINCIARDACNTTTCNFTITVVDNKPPTITCPLSVSVAGSITPPSTICKAIVNGLAPTVTDNCPMTTVGFNITPTANATPSSGVNDASGGSFSGTSTVMYTATDMAGNTASCSFNVAVNCSPCLASFNYAIGELCNIIQFTNLSSGTPPITYSWNFGDPPSGANNTSTLPNPFHQFPSCGTFTVCLKITTGDGCRDSVCRQITIDNVVPTMTCPANTTVTCLKDTTPSVTGRPVVTDNCSTPVLTYVDVVSGSLPCDGSIRRTWTATDACGNKTTCTQTIFVRDNVPPIITNCPQNLTVNTNVGQCYYTFPTLPVITSTDNCDPTPSVSYSYINSLGITLPFTTATQFPKGINTIKITVKDACNNVSRDCIFTLTVVDNEKPKIICPPSITVSGALVDGICKANVTGIAPTVTDNCPMVNTTYTINSLSFGTNGSGTNDASGMSFMGTSSVTYTATDMGGNTASCSFTGTVRCDSSGTSIFKCGMAVITCFSGFIPGTSTVNASGPVIATIDERNHATAPLGVNWTALSSSSNQIGGIYHAPTWDARNMGQLFGVTIDLNYNVYASSTTMYGKYMPSNMTNADYGNVYKIDAVTGVPTRIAQLPQAPSGSTIVNPAGLGDIWYDDVNNQLFVSNFYDGKIYRMTTTGVLLDAIGTEYDFPGVAGNPLFPSVTEPGFAPLGQRVWAVARNGNKLYFSVWNEDKGCKVLIFNGPCVQRNSATVNNQIYSVGLNALGKPIGAAVLERTIPDLPGYQYSSPVSDITFSSSGRMLVAERSMNNDFGNAYNLLGAQAHQSRILEFSGPSWSSMKTMYIGNVFAGVHANSAGGIDYGYESFNTNVANPKPVLCDSMVWGTGDALRYPNHNSIPDPSILPCGGGLNDFVYGLTGIRSIGNSNIPGLNYVKDKSIYIDVDNILCTVEKTQLGDVDIFKNCINCGNPTPQYPCDSLMVMVNSIASPVPNQCCYSVSLKNLSGNITKICANLPTANWVFNTSTVTSAGYNLQLIGSNTLCITHTSGSIPMGNLPNVFKFCLAETQPNAASLQVITFDWYSGMNIICRDSFRTECRPPVAKDTCLIITELSANCFGENDLEYCMTFQVRNISGAPAYGLVLQNLPPGFTFGNCGCGGNPFGANGWLFDWLATPLANNATRIVCVKIISTTPILSPKNVCFNATLDIAPNCCTAPKDWCVTLKPCCNPCEKISVAVNNRDSCCYSLDFKYDCDYQVFTKIEFDILTPGVSFGSHAHNAAWSLCNVPTLTNVCIVPPLGTMPSGVFNNLFSFCLTDINSPLEIPQRVKIKYWMLGSNGQDSLACDTILRFNCGYTQRPCVFITDEKIECIKDSMKYKITVTVKNLSSPSFTAYNLMFIGSGLTPNPVPLIPPLPNDGTVRTVTFCYTPTPWPDADGLLYLSYRLKDLEGDTCCNGNQTLIDTLVLPSCDTCKCKPNSFTGLNYRPTQGVPQQFVTCGDTLSANCTIPNWTMGGNFQCTGNSCPSVIQMKWILRGGGTTQIGTMTGPNFNISIPTSYFTVAGLYNLELQGICGSDTCRCIFIIRATGCPCCQNRDQFVQAVNNAVSILVDNTLCKATVNIGTLPSCDAIQTINWGDGTSSAASSMVMHTYSASGTYIITMLAIERNPSTGLICFEYQKRDTIRLVCGGQDSCDCGAFTISYVTGFNQPLSKRCGDTIVVNNTSLGNIWLYNTFFCIGNSCPDSVRINWTMTGPAGFTPFSGGTTTATPSFTPSFLTSSFTHVGLYTFTMTGFCGTKQCTCKLYFRVDTTCCGNRDQFVSNINSAVSILVNNASCKATVNIGNLPSCDAIQNIQWGDGVTSTGLFGSGTMPMHTYTGSGTYVITILAIERNPATGQICFEYLKRDTIRLNCQPSDTCRCGSFSDIFYRPSQGAASQPKVCGDTLIVPCNTTFTPIVTGVYNCLGTCPTSGIKWELRKTSSGPVLHMGTMPANFNLPLSLAYFTTAGTYELTLIPQCGSLTCPPCKFIIKVLPPVSLSTDLTGYFPFNSNANDVSPTAINGTTSNLIPAAALNGALNSAYSFNGSNSMIDATTNNRGVTDKVSVCAWVRTTETLRGMWVAGQYSGGQAKGYLLSIGDVTNSAGSIGLASFSGRVNLSNYYAAIAPNTMKVNNGAWHCIVGTAGIGTSGVSEWKIYVDGVLANTVLGATSTIAPTTTPFTIGRHSDPNIGPNLMWYNGNMDDVRVYNKVLTQCEIDALCATGFVSGVGDINDRMRFSIFPNPTKDIFTVELSTPAQSNMRFRVVDLIGRMILEKPIEVGNTQQTVSASDLSEGLYFLQVVLDGKVVGVEKFVKQ